MAGFYRVDRVLKLEVVLLEERSEPRQLGIITCEVQLSGPLAP